MSGKKRILLLDIDDTLIDFQQSTLCGQSLWLGGGPEIWQSSMQALQQAGAAIGLEIEFGLATFKTFKDFLAQAVETSFAALLNKAHLYYDTQKQRSKAKFALNIASKDLQDKQQVAIMDDLKAVCDEAQSSGYIVVSTNALATLRHSVHSHLKQQQIIVGYFAEIAKQWAIPCPYFAAKQQELAKSLSEQDQHLQMLLGNLATPRFISAPPPILKKPAPKMYPVQNILQKLLSASHSSAAAASTSSTTPAKTTATSTNPNLHFRKQLKRRFEEPKPGSAIPAEEQPKKEQPKVLQQG